MMKTYPGLTIAKFKQAMVFSGAALDQMAESLRKLGLPE
jgi:adenylate cyclase